MACKDPLSDLSDVVLAARDAVIQAMELGVIVLDSQDCVIDMNPAAQGIVDQAARAHVGQPISVLLSKWSDLAGLLEDTSEGQAEISIEEDAGERFFEVRLSMLHDRHGGELGRLVLLRDVTERKRVEMALREAKIAAEASDQAKSEFMSVASHEMRTPITSIKGYTDLLARSTVGPINDTQADFLATIRTNADRIALLVSDLSDIARIESGRLNLELSMVTIPGVIRDAVEGMRTQVEEKNQVLSVDVPDDLPPVRADHERLVQVVSNLVSNAHKFTPEGGRIAVRAGRESRPGCRGDEMKEPGIFVAVEDNGIGIRVEEQDKVFEKFYRSEDRKASEIPGSGLGLSIAANLIEMQGGEIQLESVFREGTTVRFTLPVTPSS